jgi:hypothetical protein
MHTGAKQPGRAVTRSQSVCGVPASTGRLDIDPLAPPGLVPATPREGVAQTPGGLAQDNARFTDSGSSRGHTVV